MGHVEAGGHLKYGSGGEKWVADRKPTLATTTRLVFKVSIQRVKREKSSSPLSILVARRNSATAFTEHLVQAEHQ